MNIFIFCSILGSFMLFASTSALYDSCYETGNIVLFHSGNERYLSYDYGRRDKSAEDQNLQPYSLELGKTLLYVRPGYLVKAQNQAKVLEIEGGCRLGGKIVPGVLDKSKKSQFWKFYKDGSIGSHCDPSWILYIDYYGDQMVKKRADVDEADRSFRIWR